MIPNTRVIAVCSNQIGRVGNVAHVVGQHIGDGNGEVDGGVMRDQFELVIDIGLAICAVARVDGSAASLKVTGSVAGRVSGSVGSWAAGSVVGWVVASVAASAVVSVGFSGV